MFNSIIRLRETEVIIWLLVECAKMIVVTRQVVCVCQHVVKGEALAPVLRTGTKGWAFSSGRAAPAREPGQQTLPDRC